MLSSNMLLLNLPLLIDVTFSTPTLGYTQNPSMSVMAFHEKTGRSQVGSFVFSLDTIFLFGRVASTVATLPSALFDERFSLGASWAFSFQPALLPDYRPPVPSLG